MALEIGGATIGYNKDNLNKTYDKLHTSCVKDTKDLMKQGMEDIKRAVGNAWVGSSADMFYANFDRDRTDYVEKKLNEVDTLLKNQFDNLISDLNKREDTLVNKRQGGGR